MIHKGDVSDGQTEGFDPRESFLVGECRHFAAKLIEGFVQIEHATSLTDVGRTPLRHRRHALPLLGRRRSSGRTARPRRPAGSPAENCKVKIHIDSIVADPFYETLKSFFSFFRMRTCGLANYITAILPLRKAKSEGHIDVDCCWSSIAQEEETLRRKIDLTSRGNRLVFKVIVSKKELPLVGAGRTSWQGSNCTEGINRFRESRSVCDWQLLRAKAIPRPLPTRKTKDKSASPLWRRLLPMPTYLSPERKRKASLFFPFDSIRRRRLGITAQPARGPFTLLTAFLQILELCFLLLLL